MDESSLGLLNNYLLVGALVFGIGLVGFIARRNMIVMFLSAEMMLQGISISLVAWSRLHNDWGGQVLVIFIITVAACEAAVALALILMLVRTAGSLDITYWHRMRESNQPRWVDSEVEQLPDEEPSPVWPMLSPAGVEPERDNEELTHRTHV